MKPFINSNISPDDILNAVYLAAEAIMEVYSQTEIESEKKEDDSPVTIADIRAHNIIEETLLKSGWPILSEEGEHPSYSVRKNWDYFWVVDPLDGTKEFIKGNGEFTINVALVKGNAPIWGVVHSPVLDWTYIGGPKVGSLKSAGRLNYSEIKEKGQSLPGKLPDKLTVVASRSHGSPSTESLLDKWEKKYGKMDRISMGSSLKICLVAEGSAYAYPRAALTMEWDTAAGHAIALGAKCHMFRMEELNNELSWSQPLVYNKENLLNPFFIVCGVEYLCKNA
jgi:3'(2'), 5'-bisphosphate nucleotidase|tara:strand:+ start:7424 stop:8266 length:843 start_codon:yes stop_codon:yes gene_type:complete